MSTFVLVHGSFHGGWCYSRVAARLRAQMHEVYTPTLSGLGDSACVAGKLINLSTHIQDVVDLFQTHDLEDVILCGHSSGGMVITGVAGQIGERVRTLFYLDAAVPESGQSSFDLLGPEGTLAALALAGDTGTTLVPLSAEAYQVNPADIEWVDRMCTPHPVGCFLQKLHYTGKEQLVIHRTYVLCERFHWINHSTYERVKDLPGWKAVSVDTGHDIMINDPDLVVKLLLEESTRN